MPEVLQKRIVVYANDGYDRQRQHRERRDHDADHARYRQPKEFRVSDDDHQERCLDRVARLQHPAKQLAGVRIVRRDRVNIAILSFFQIIRLHRKVSRSMGPGRHSL